MKSFSVYQRIADPLEAVKALGIDIAKSGMFGSDMTESQGRVLGWHCLITGCDPLTIIESFHIMHGRVTLKAEEMIARVVDDGGTYQVIEHSKDAAEILIEYRGRTFRERFTWEDARQEPFVYAGKPKDIMPLLVAGQYDKLTISTNYATPRRRMQHLWARVVSDSVRVIAPNLLRGKYTPEEMHQAAIDDGRIKPNAPMPLVEATEESEAFDAAFEVKQDPPITYEPKSEDDAELGKMLSRINELFIHLGVPGDQQLAAIKKRGARDMGGLTREQAADLLNALTAKAAAAVSEQLSQDEQQFAQPASETQIAEIKSLLAQVVQLEGMGKLGEQVRDHLSKYQLRLADLSDREARTFIKSLSERNLELFFGLSLQGYKVARESAKNPE